MSREEGGSFACPGLSLMAAHIFVNDLQANRKGMALRLAGERLLPSLSPLTVCFSRVRGKNKLLRARSASPACRGLKCIPESSKLERGSRPTIHQELPLSRHPKKALVRSG